MGEYLQEDVDKLTADENKLNKQLDDALPQIINRKKIVWMCSSIKHCEMVYSALLCRGEKASMIHSKQSDDVRELHGYDFESGDSRHLVFVTIVSCGWDYPPTDTVILMRPTRSSVMMIQVVGRALRPSQGKGCAYVLDFGGVVEACGPLDDPIINQGRSSRKSVKEIKAKFCQKCLSYCHISAKTCIDCGHPFYENKPKLQNLSEKSQAGSILKQPKITRVKSLIVEEYHSTNTNKVSLRVTYHLADLLSDGIREYFSRENSFFIKKRMSELGIDYIIGAKHYVIGRSVEIEREGKYDKIKRVIRD
jgi:DNA repair protein RadD